MMHQERETTVGKWWTAHLRMASTRRASWLKTATRSMEAFENMAWDPDKSAVSGEEPIVHNKHFAAVRSRIAALVPKRTEAHLKALDPTEAPQVKNAERLLNWNIYTIDFEEVARDVVLDALVYGVGVTYTTWGAPVTPVVVGQTATLGAANPMGDANVAKEAERQEAVAWAFPNPWTGEDLSQVFRVAPRDFLLDPQAIRIRDARWAAHRYWLTKREILRLVDSKFFTLKHPENLTWESLEKIDPVDEGQRAADVKARQESGLASEDEADFEMWGIWMIHDFQRHEVLHLLPGMDEPLRARPNTLGCPYHALRPLATTTTFWASPAFWHFGAAQEALNQMLNALVDLADKCAPKLFIPDGQGDQESLEKKIAETPPGGVCSLPVAVIQAMQWSPPPAVPEVMKILPAEVKAIITESTGESEVMSGVLSSPAGTATEAGIQAGAQNQRVADDSDQLSGWMKGVCRRMAFLLQKFLVAAKAVPIIGLDATGWGPIESHEGKNLRAEDIRGAFDIQVYAGQKAEMMRAEHRKFLMDTLSQVGPWAAAGVLDITPLLRKIVEANGLDPKEVGLAERVSPEQVMQVMQMSQSGPMRADMGRGPSEMGPKSPEMAPDQRTRNSGGTDAGQATASRRQAA